MTTPVADILIRIVEQRRFRFGVQRGLDAAAMAANASAASTAMTPVVAPAGDAGSVPFAGEQPFLRALEKRRGSAIIAEVKMGSPRLGDLTGKINPVTQAKLYRDSGAAALSVVVEPDFFRGSYELLSRCREAAGLPAIAKDFIVSPEQIRLARRAGADAVLLIAALYEAADLRAWASVARAEGLVPLIETHGQADLAKLTGAEWELVGINNRDLKTFEVDLEHSIERVGKLPRGALRVAESGIGSGEDVSRLAAAGFDAFLVGESLLLANDPEAKLRELIGAGR